MLFLYNFVISKANIKLNSTINSLLIYNFMILHIPKMIISFMNKSNIVRIKIILYYTIFYIEWGEVNCLCLNIFRTKTSFLWSQIKNFHINCISCDDKVMHIITIIEENNFSF